MGISFSQAVAQEAKLLPIRGELLTFVSHHGANDWEVRVRAEGELLHWLGGLVPYHETRRRADWGAGWRAWLTESNAGCVLLVEYLDGANSWVWAITD